MFTWRRRCTILGTDPFDQILLDIANYYNVEEWRDFADANVFLCASTEKKQRMALRKGVSLVSGCLLFECFYHCCRTDISLSNTLFQALFSQFLPISRLLLHLPKT